MARRTMTDTGLSLEYFERIEVNPRLTLLRVGGSPAPDESLLALVVSVDGEDFRTTPLGGSVSVEDGGRWRAAFPVPSERLEGTELSYTLETGETIELPEPAVRRLPNRAEEEAVAPPEEPALAEEPEEELPVAAEEPAVVEEPPPGDEEPAAVEEPTLAEEPRVDEETAVAEEPPVAEGPVAEEEAALAEEPALAEEVAVAEEPVAVEEPPVAEEPAVAPAEPGGADASGLARAPRRGRRWWLLAVVALVIAVVVAVAIIVVASNSTDDNGTTLSKKSTSGGRTPATLQALPEAPKGVKAGVTPISDGRATLTVSGLPAGIYEAWLYNDILDAQPLATFHGPKASVALKFPADVGHFQELDVSHEGDGNPGHSGRSVLRVPLASLTG